MTTTRLTPPPACLDCAAPFRPKNVPSPADGSRVHHARGLCRGCANARAAGRAKHVPTPAPPTCVVCARTFGTREQVSASARHLVEHVGRGRCDACYKRERYRAKVGGQLTRQPRPDACTACERPLYSQRQTPRPGAVRHYSRGLCHGCHAAKVAAGRPPARARRPEHCVDCGITLRAQHTAHVEGTQMHAGRGMCAPCYETDRRLDRQLARIYGATP